MTFGIGRHVDFDVGKLACLSYSPLQSKNGSIRCNTCRINNDVFHCNKESCGPSRVVSRIVISIHHSPAIEIGSCFEYRHVVGISNEDGIESQVQLFGESIGPSWDENLCWSSGYFIVVAVPALSVIINRVL